ncbi:MAG: bifunctional UDP-3-O-[3-hydroxymyristoyl] N-acetylglucosamine deacetylase/3-hydroxyacyl-ACP dehydratase [Gemmatimonadota bacterium]
MSSGNQQTLGGEVTLTGVGVHTGEEASLAFRPAPPGHGIRFRRLDLEGEPEIPADLEHVVGTELGTSIGSGEVRVLTVEHVMAALRGRGVDNALLELRGPEPPIRDGSFRDFDEALAGLGLEEQDQPARVIRLTEPVAVDIQGEEEYVAAPGSGLRISATIDFQHPSIGRQFGSFDITPQAFSRELAPARTFGFESAAEALRARGLARGASLENTVVLGEDGVLNDDLRFPDEFVRHKVGDLVGDLALLNARVEAHVVATRPSHHGNVELARALAQVHRRRGGAPIVDAQKIMEYLPHRFPMLLVDRVVDFESGKRIVGLKNVTINEPFFQGHYPGHPIMPGVLIIEAMAQAGGLLLMDSIENPQDKVVYFMSLDNVKWRRPVTPGDQLIFEIRLLQLRRQVCKMRGEAFVDGKLVAEAELMARIMDR